MIRNRVVSALSVILLAAVISAPVFAASKKKIDRQVLETLEEFNPMVRLVALSGKIADIWCHPNIEQSAQDAIQAANTVLGEGPEMLEAILTGVAEGLPVASAWFEMDLGSSEENERIIHTAQESFLKTSGKECRS